MTIQVLTFAALRERLGFAEKKLSLDPPATVLDAARQVFDGEPPAGLAYAVNQAYADPATALGDGDELAILPPVAGGAPDDIARVQTEPIDVAALQASCADPGAGAVLTFLGTAREVPDEVLVHLCYEAYTSMAERFLADLAAELRQEFELARVALVHRTGELAAGEASVAIVVSSPHRASGFDALRYAIERIKEKAPIWKKEVTRKRAHWVNADKIDPAS